MTQEQTEKFIKAQKEGRQLFPFERLTDDNQVEQVYLFAEELTKEHKDLLTQQMVHSYTSLPKDVQQDFLKVVSKPSLKDKLVIVQSI